MLTHTGQKPFQCGHCPLLFTTKSNCDRHVARKHSGGGNAPSHQPDAILRGKLSEKQQASGSGTASGHQVTGQSQVAAEGMSTTCSAKKRKVVVGNSDQGGEEVGDNEREVADDEEEDEEDEDVEDDEEDEEDEEEEEEDDDYDGMVRKIGKDHQHQAPNQRSPGGEKSSGRGKSGRGGGGVLTGVSENADGNAATAPAGTSAAMFRSVDGSFHLLRKRSCSHARVMKFWKNVFAGATFVSCPPRSAP